MRHGIILATTVSPWVYLHDFDTTRTVAFRYPHFVRPAGGFEIFSSMRVKR